MRNEYTFFFSDNVNEIFDMLMQKENMDDGVGVHQIVRKSRGPQLRLRFGKRSDYVSGNVLLLFAFVI